MDRSLPRLALVAFAMVVLAVFLYAGVTSTAAFGLHNPSWEGTADFRALANEEAATDTLTNVSTYETAPAEDTLAVVLSPSDAYGDDAAAVRRFLERGGTVVLAEDYRPHANQLLSDLDATVRFDGRPVRDERNFERSPTFVEADVTATRTLPSVETLVLNRGTVLEPDNATVLAHTSRDAYLDVDRDGTLDSEETPERRPVLAVESVGDGELVTLADPSVFINSMLEFGDNRALAAHLTGEYDRVLFDVSHAGGVPPLVGAVLLVRDSPLLQVTIGGLLVFLVVGRHRLWSLLEHRRDDIATHPSRTRPDPAAIAQSVSDDHPDWDESRIERVTEQVVESRPESEESVETESRR